MRVLGIRFCQVSEVAEALGAFLDQLGLHRRALDEHETGEGAFTGAIFPAGASWIEIWQAADGMPAGIMLQVVVDDADAFAAHARQHGLRPEGPIDAHGERIYSLTAPGGLAVSFQSTRA